MKNKISITINERIIKDINSLIDNIYIRNRSQAIEFLVNKALGEDKIAVILAGGNEEKLKLFGNAYKPTAKIGGSTVIEIAIKKLRRNGFKTVYIVARHNVLTSIFQIIADGVEYGVKVNYIEEKESQGSADSLKLLRGKIKTSFLVVYCDIIFDAMDINGIWERHLKHKAISTLMITSVPTSSIYLGKVGHVKVEGNKMVEFVEKPPKAESTIFFCGLFMAEPELLEYKGHSLETEVFQELIKKGYLYGYLSSKEYLHIHNKDDIKIIGKKLK